MTFSAIFARSWRHGRLVLPGHSASVRLFSGVVGPSNEAEEIIERNLRKKHEDEPSLATPATTAREARSLYRLILRTCRLFLWPNERGVLWRDVLQASARAEFDRAKFETDPEMIARLLVGGRDAVDAITQKMLAKLQSSEHSRGPPPRAF